MPLLGAAAAEALPAFFAVCVCEWGILRGQTFRPAVFPARNRVVNSIRFCFLWERKNSGRVKEREERWARGGGGSKTLVCSVSGDGGSQRYGGEVWRNIKGEVKEREGGGSQTGSGREPESSRTKNIYDLCGVWKYL